MKLLLEMKTKPHYSSVTLIFKYFQFSMSLCQAQVGAFESYNLLFCSRSLASSWILNRNRNNKPTVENLQDNQGDRFHVLFGKKWNVRKEMFIVL